MFHPFLLPLPGVVVRGVAHVMVHKGVLGQLIFVIRVSGLEQQGEKNQPLASVI